MFRRTAATIAVVVAAGSALTGVASAAAPVHKGPAVKRASVVMTPVALVGTPLHGNPGDANKAECQALADLAQNLHDIGGQQNENAADKTLDLGQARGCVFTGSY